jgi:phosphohistidine phosphatase
MKRLTIMRHAKSSWDDFSLSDYARPLNERGLRDAPLMGEVLSKKDLDLDLFLSSPAKRAKTTAEIIANAIGFGAENITYQESIYESSEFNLLMMIKGLDETVNSCMIVGHNPALTAIINKLSNFTLLNLPTAGVVSIEFSTPWSEIAPYKGEMLFYEYPKKYRD